MYSDFTIVGNVGRDPELRYTASGVEVCNFSVAVNRSWTDTAGEKQEKTTWYRVTTWRKLATICSEYLQSGSKVLVNADDLDVNAWVDREGSAQGQIELTARRVVFLSSRGENGVPPAAVDAPPEPAAAQTAAPATNGSATVEEDPPF